MMYRDRRIYGVIFLAVVAPIGAAVVVLALLLFGADPHSVFIAGHAAKWGLQRLGLPAPNAVGVLATLFVWWGIIVVIGLAWERARRRTTT
ncbi:MAG TPA: hypothetical protein VGE86_08400 [Thermoanaerobaculia bacterium]